MVIAAQVVDENPELAKEVMKLLAFARKILHAIRHLASASRVYMMSAAGIVHSRVQAVQASFMELSLSTACRRPSLP